MLHLVNRTPFRASLTPVLDKEGREHAVVLIKGTFRVGAGGALAVGEEQAPILHGDEHHGQAATSSVRWASDVGPTKAGTDVALIGDALAPSGGTRELDVELSVGPLRKRVRVFGERHWYRSAGGWKASEPQPFEAMPLVWERAFGGTDTSAADPAHHERDDRNPVGVGFRASRSAKPTEGQPLPNLEALGARFEAPTARPPPAGFGFVARHWQPRAALAGTYDARWRRERFPLLPEDFDPRHFNAAPADLVASPPLRGGERARVSGVSLDGPFVFDVPARAFEVRARVRGETASHAPTLDTLVIEPGGRRVTVSWRATFACPRSFLLIDEVLVRELEVPA